MPAKQQGRVPVTCPHCGHTQEEPRAAYSTTCKQCGKHYRVQEILNPSPKAKERPKDRKQVTCPRCGHSQEEPHAAYSTVCKKCHQHYRIEETVPVPSKTPERPREVRRVACFQCGTELEVVPAAKSTMCKRCSSFVDLSDYRIDHSVSKNFKTKGRFVVEEKGFLFNTDSIVGQAVIKGKVHGKLVTEGSMEIHSSAQIKGSLQTAQLIIPAGHHFRWDDTLVVGSAEIGGELAAHLRARERIVLKATARMFGNLEAKTLVVENGAVFVGTAKIGVST